MPDFEYFIEGEDDFVFAVEVGPDGIWLPGESGEPGPRAFRIRRDASFERLPRSSFSRWFKMARQVSREEALSVARSNPFNS